MTTLVTGGAGYIGSHRVQALVAAGESVVVLDSLVTGHADAVPAGLLVQGDIGDAGLLDALLTRHRITAVMHFAGFIQVGESVSDPVRYYQNNVAATQVLLDALRRHGVSQLVFSSSAAVYGVPDVAPIPEDAPLLPINPYGRSKAFVEAMLVDYACAYGLNSVSLRYFNAAGAAPDGTLGERHDPETHLIPRVLEVASGRATEVTLFGTDYATPDGSCVRDYVHVVDLCAAHRLALRYLEQGGATTAFNLGNGAGYSVREVIAAARLVTGHPIPVAVAPRRAGDPPILVASSARAAALLGWTPRHSALPDLLADAWRFARRGIS